MSAGAPPAAQTRGVTPRHAPPFHCPFCGEEDIRPYGEDAGQWRCGSCIRVWKLNFVGLAPTPDPEVVR
ncbi:MAG: Insertion element protein [Geodermatophilaceae bacterium]|nr:Insertion element protein [Geodermatophilaceae bacterium]